MSNLENFLDLIPLWLILSGSFALMIFGVELGFRFGSHWPGKESKAQPAQVRALMGAGLGLLGFMLAFSFSIAQSHYDDRNQAYMQEVTAISSAYISAEFLAKPESTKARGLLREFVDNRIEIIENVQSMEASGLIGLVTRGEDIHQQLLNITRTDAEADQSRNDSMFLGSVIRMIEANEQRKQASLYNRVSPIIWYTLSIMSVLAMMITGYQAGLTGSHSRIATWSLAITFAMVMAIVIDLDRPRMTLFQLNQQQMLDLQSKMTDSDRQSESR